MYTLTDLQQNGLLKLFVRYGNTVWQFVGMFQDVLDASKVVESGRGDYGLSVGEFFFTARGGEALPPEVCEAIEDNRFGVYLHGIPLVATHELTGEELEISDKQRSDIRAWCDYLKSLDGVGIHVSSEVQK